MKIQEKYHLLWNVKVPMRDGVNLSANIYISYEKKVFL